MQHILLGLALISASLQTGWALFAEGQVYALALVVLTIIAGSMYVISGLLRRGLYRI